MPEKQVKGETGTDDVMSTIFQLTQGTRTEEANQEANVKAKEITYRRSGSELYIRGETWTKSVERERQLVFMFQCASCSRCSVETTEARHAQYVDASV